MNALRHFVTSSDGTIQITVPAEYTKRPLEIIILPADEAAPLTPICNRALPHLAFVTRSEE